MAELRALTETWLRIYNSERPHDSLGRVPPLTFLAEAFISRAVSLCSVYLTGKLYRVAMPRDAGGTCFVEMDVASGIPALPHMVMEGQEVPRRDRPVSSAEGSCRCAHRRRATAAGRRGRAPAPLSAVRPPGRPTRVAIDGRTHGVRRAAVRGIGRLPPPGPRMLVSAGQIDTRSVAPSRRRAVHSLLRRVREPISRDQINPVVRLAEELLEPHGGLLFEGYRSDAPKGWRQRPT